MAMKSEKRGKNTSKVEVSHISTQGIWLLIENTEYFLKYKDFPWFKNARVRDIQNVQLFHKHHLHWKSLDIDLELESLKSLEKYPLKSVA